MSPGIDICSTNLDKRTWTSKVRGNTHIHARDRRKRRVVSTPIGHDVPLEAGLVLQELVERVVIFAGIGVVDQIYK